MQKAIYFDQTRCTGCETCVIACKDWHEYELGTEPANWLRVVELETGSYPNLSVSYIALPCLHCAQPSCLEACPVGAFSKRLEDGAVVVDRQKCLGKDECGMLCQLTCPYQAPQFGTEANAKVQKCDLCLERWAEGKLPVCVAACPMRALDAGGLEELRQKYGSGRQAVGFAYSTDTLPCVVLKAKSRNYSSQ